MKTFNLKLLVLWLLASILGGIVGEQAGTPAVKLYEVVRTPLFAGMIALIGVVVAFRGTWLPRLREAYEADEHVENVKELREGGTKVDYYGGFYRLASALNAAGFILALTAVVQMTLGFWNSPYAPGACMGAATATLVIFLYLLHRLRRVEVFWIKKLEQEQERKQRLPAGPAAALRS